jgi:predicted nucleic acid-binding protein
VSLRLYLDTSVISALHDRRAPDRQALTAEFFGRLGEFLVGTSELTLKEIERTVQISRRDEMRESIRPFSVFRMTLAAQNLAEEYLQGGALPRSAPEDALHVAIAVLERQDVLVSWNFKHLVNRQRRAMVDAINSRLGLPPIAILPPPEV